MQLKETLMVASPHMTKCEMDYRVRGKYTFLTKMDAGVQRTNWRAPHSTPREWWSEAAFFLSTQQCHSVDGQWQWMEDATHGKTHGGGWLRSWWVMLVAQPDPRWPPYLWGPGDAGQGPAALHRCLRPPRLGTNNSVRRFPQQMQSTPVKSWDFGVFFSREDPALNMNDIVRDWSKSRRKQMGSFNNQCITCHI